MHNRAFSHSLVNIGSHPCGSKTICLGMGSEFQKKSVIYVIGCRTIKLNGTCNQINKSVVLVEKIVSKQKLKFLLSFQSFSLAFILSSKRQIQSVTDESSLEWRRACSRKSGSLPGLMYWFVRAHSSRIDANFLNGAPENSKSWCLIIFGWGDNHSQVKQMNMG